MAKGSGSGLGWGGHSISEMMLKCQKQVSNILKGGKFSEGSIKQAIDTIENYGEKLGAKIEQYKNSLWGQKYIKEDDQPLNVAVESVGVAHGENAEVNNHVSLGVFDIGDTAKLCIATAESYAAAEGGDNPQTYVNTFSQVSGVDTGSIHTYYQKGANFEKAVECLVAIDWESVYDRNWVFSKHHSFYSRKEKELGEGKKMHATIDNYVEADNSVELHNEIQQLAYGDTLIGTASVDATVS